MGAVRVVLSSNSQSIEREVPNLIEQAQLIRKEPGCLQFEFFRGNEFPENFVQLELWESPEAYDDHWKRHSQRALFDEVAKLEAPYHHGPPAFPRRHGVNGCELYHHTYFQQVAGAFTPVDSDKRSESIRWPAVPRPVRIVIQSSTDPSEDDAYLAYSSETRQEPGCLQFDYYRSLEFPENKLHLELWEDPPEVYDVHYLHRHLQRIWDIGVRQSPRPVERRYGKSGMEFYPHRFFTLDANNTWQPEDVETRMITVRWP